MGLRQSKGKQYNCTQDNLFSKEERTALDGIPTQGTLHSRRALNTCSHKPIVPISHLDHEGDEEGKHGEGEAEDVEERQSHKGLVCRQSVIGVTGVFVYQYKCGKCCQGNLW